MIRPIVTDTSRLNQSAVTATVMDMPTVNDLKDTLTAHQDHCVGMAANMIGVNKRIIIAEIGPLPVIMINPVITKSRLAYQTSEGCLSLQGERPTKRYQEITVEFLNEKFQPQTQTFNGFPAQIIQHEVDHCNGILI